MLSRIVFTRAGAVSFLFAGVLGIAGARPAGAQTAAPQPTPAAALRPVLAQVSQAVNGVNPQSWRAPSDVKSVVAGDIEAIQRDLAGTLAGLLDRADAAPGSVPLEFAVYRNVDALYDTLLRVVETADLVAPNQEAAALESALESLERARGQLGDVILTGAQAQQDQLTGLQNAIRAAEAAERVPVRTTVVDDWSKPHPATEHRHTAHRRSTTEKKPATHSKTISSETKKTTPPPNPQ